VSTLYSRRSHGWAWLWLTLSVMGIAAASGSAVIAFRKSPPPTIEIMSDLPGIGAKTTITVKVREPVRGLGGVKVELLHGQLDRVVGEEEFEPRSVWSFGPAPTAEHTFTVVVGRSITEGLAPGEATVRVTAQHPGAWLANNPPVVNSVTLPVRFVPPALTPTSSRVYVTQGGCEAVAYQVGASAVRDGVEVGDWFFPGYPMPGAPPDTHFALFAVPYDVADASRVKLVALDGLGNRAEASFVEQFFPKAMGTETINLTDAFMQKVVGEILSRSPEIHETPNLLDNYLAINGTLRRANSQALRDLAKQTKAQFLWQQPFRPFANAKVMGSFADHRTYVYEGKEVDAQDHLGLDLASVRQAPVSAANDGIVVLAKYFGVFGNTVVIDHGYGLMSLYAHLSSIEVAEGAPVQRGQLIAKTGATGLAGGDHLHFSMLLQGLPVNPVEWWDAHWIHDRIASKLGNVLFYNGRS
jgi:murein DD-endopeptidase MepM/ murein hydrolase activator NlpD